MTDTPLAHVTGTARHVPTEDEVKAMKAYVESGGVLLIDNCGGGSAFTSGLRETLEQAFPGAVPVPLDPVRTCSCAAVWRGWPTCRSRCCGGTRRRC